MKFEGFDLQLEVGTIDLLLAFGGNFLNMRHGKRLQTAVGNDAGFNLANAAADDALLVHVQLGALGHGVDHGVGAKVFGATRVVVELGGSTFGAGKVTTEAILTGTLPSKHGELVSVEVDLHFLHRVAGQILGGIFHRVDDDGGLEFLDGGLELIVAHDGIDGVAIGFHVLELRDQGDGGRHAANRDFRFDFDCIHFGDGLVSHQGGGQGEAAEGEEGAAEGDAGGDEG